MKSDMIFLTNMSEIHNKHYKVTQKGVLYGTFKARYGDMSTSARTITRADL